MTTHCKFNIPEKGYVINGSTQRSLQLNDLFPILSASQLQGLLKTGTNDQHLSRVRSTGYDRISQILSTTRQLKSMLREDKFKIIAMCTKGKLASISYIKLKTAVWNGVNINKLLKLGLPFHTFWLFLHGS